MRSDGPGAAMRTLTADTGAARLGRRPVESTGVAALICLAAAATGVGLVLTLDGTLEAIRERPAAFALFAGLTLGLQLMPVELYERGSLSVAGIGVLATGFLLGPGPAMVTAAVCTGLHLARTRVRMHKAIFSTSAVTLAAGAGAIAYELVPGGNLGARFGAAVLAGAVYWAVNIALAVLRLEPRRACSVRDRLARALPLAHAALPRFRPNRACAPSSRTTGSA